MSQSVPVSPVAGSAAMPPPAPLSPEEKFERLYEHAKSMESRSRWFERKMEEYERKFSEIEGTARRASLIPDLENRLHEMEAKSQSAVMLPSASHGPRVPPPEPFSGSSKDDVHNWVFQLEQYFLLYPALPEEQKICHAAAYLRKDAALWWRFLKQSEVFVETFNDFCKLLKTQFEGSNPVQRLEIVWQLYDSSRL